tara:strand:- start:596 stop:1027 length:432 start_codon:yes stop_codon:yes gene_type:complete
MRKALLSDIDGTISDRSHRLHHLEGKKDWKSFFSEMHNDPPIMKTISRIENLLSNYDTLIFVTGRPEKYRFETEKWIQNNTDFKNYELLMRANNNFEKDVIIKKEMLDKIRENFGVDTIFEDQIELANFWREQGLKCIQIEVT